MLEKEGSTQPDSSSGVAFARLANLPTGKLLWELATNLFLSFCLVPLILSVTSLRFPLMRAALGQRRRHPWRVSGKISGRGGK